MAMQYGPCIYFKPMKTIENIGSESHKTTSNNTRITNRCFSATRLSARAEVHEPRVCRDLSDSDFRVVCSSSHFIISSRVCYHGVTANGNQLPLCTFSRRPMRVMPIRSRYDDSIMNI